MMSLLHVKRLVLNVLQEPYECNYWPWEFEVLAVVNEQYLQGHKFTVYTDHQALTRVREMKSVALDVHTQ